MTAARGQPSPPNPRKPLFERLKSGLSEAIPHAKGKLTLKTVTVLEAPPAGKR